MSAGQLQMYNPIWQLFNNNGQPLTNGAIFFFEKENHDTPKDVFIDDTGVTAWPNPIVLNAAGFQPQNYGIFGNGAYYVEVHLTDDRSSETIFTQDNLIPPQVSGSGPNIPTDDIQNFILNSQFTVYGQTYETTGISVPASILNLAPGGWVFVKNDTSAVDSISFPQFIPGQDEVPSNPNNYFSYICDSVSSTENLKYLGYRFRNYSSYGLNAGSGVNTLAGQEVTLQFEGISSTASVISVNVYQYFGANGSAPVLTSIGSFNLQGQWSTTAQGEPFNVTFTIPAISGKTIDPNGGDYLEIRWNIPLNGISNIGVVNVCLQSISSFVAFQPIPINDLQTSLLGLQLPVVTAQSNAYLDGRYALEQNQNSLSFSLVPLAGRRMPWSTNTAPSYGLICNGLPYYSYQYYNLALAMFSSVTNSLPWGCGPQGFTASLATATVTATCFTNGTVVAGSAGTTPFTYNQVSTGGPSSQGQATILCTAGSTLPQDATTTAKYLLINSPATSYYLWLCFNNFTIDPGTFLSALSGKTGIKVIYTGTETDAQIGALVLKALATAHFRVPDVRGLLSRMPNFGATAVLPSFGTLTLTSANNLAAINFTITGLDVNGNALTPEVLAGPNAGTVTSVNSYSAITSITTSNTATAVSVGITAPSNTTALALLQTVTGAGTIILNGIYSRDPDYASRYAMYTGGATGDNTGSQQTNQNLNHMHDIVGQQNGNPGLGITSNPDNGNFFAGAAHSTVVNLITAFSGGNQSNPNNVNENQIILF